MNGQTFDSVVVSPDAYCSKIPPGIKRNGLFFPLSGSVFFQDRQNELWYPKSGAQLREMNKVR